MDGSRRRSGGFSLLEFAVVAVVLSVLMALLLDRLAFYQEAAERARFQNSLQTFKTILQVRLAELILERREGEVRSLEAENPTRWLSETPTDYGGAYPRRPLPGTWYYDAAARELVYVANSSRRLAVEPRDGVKQLRFRVEIVYQDVAAGAQRVRGVAGIRLKPVQAFDWR